MSFRTTIRNVQQAGDKTGGWGESFWNNTSDLTAMITLSTALRQALNDVKGNEDKLPSMRISNPDTFRLVKLVNFAGAFGSFPSVYGDADYPSTALMLKLSAPGPYTSNQWIRGIPDQIVTAGGTYTPGGRPGWLAKMNTLLGILMSGSNGWSIRGLNRAIPRVPITGVNLTTGVVTCPNHALGGAGAIAKTRISGFKIPKGLNQVWRVTVIDANSFQLNFYAPPAVTVVPFGVNPTSRAQLFIYVPIQTAEIIRATSHYTGRPTALLGGRRRNRQTQQGGLPVAV
jgi:hypothetical protein